MRDNAQDTSPAARQPLPSPGQIVRGQAAAPLERAEGQIRELKAAPEFFESRPMRIFNDELGRFETQVIDQRLGCWELLPERGKFNLLLAEVDWRGVSPDDRRMLLEREVDFSRIAAGDRETRPGEVPVPGLPYGVSRLPSPGEMIRQGRAAGAESEAETGRQEERERER